MKTGWMKPHINNYLQAHSPRKLRKDLEKIITKYLEPFVDLDLGDNDVSLAVKTFVNEQISYIV